MPHTLVAIATYNELENLPSLIEAVGAAVPDADVLVVDDNSPDGTGRWAEECAAENARVHIIHREGKLGLGSATIDAFRWALVRGYERVATMDADWSHPPEELPKLLALADVVDVAVGSRYTPGGKIEGWPLARRVVSRFMNRLSRWLLRVPVADSSGAFRVYRASALRSIDLSRISSSGYAYLEEIVWRLAAAGATFAEHPITFRDRAAGRSKANLAEVRGKLGMLWRCFWTRP